MVEATIVTGRPVLGYCRFLGVGRCGEEEERVEAFQGVSDSADLRK